MARPWFITIHRFRLFLCDLVVPLMLIGLYTSASAEETPPSTSDTRDVFIILAGGASLGSYEAGYATTIVQYLRDHRRDYTVRAISGTSAGGINAFASALEYCRADGTADPTADLSQSIPYRAWMPIGWPMIYDREKVTSKAVFHFDRLTTHGIRLLASKHVAFRPHCEVPIHVAVTREMDDAMGSRPADTLKMVEYIGVQLRTDDNGRPQYFQLPPRADTPPHHVTPAGTPNQPLSYPTVMGMIRASAAFPLGFPPVDMQVDTQMPELSGDRIVTVPRTYYDGGIFDNVPVRTIFPEIEQHTYPNPLVIIVDLQDQRLPKDAPTVGADNDDLSSMTRKWMRYARQRAYAESVTLLDAQHIDTWRAYQRYPAAGGFVASFAAFLDLHFRQTDYYLGVYDAREDLREHIEQEDALPPQNATSRCIEDILHGGRATFCDDQTLSTSLRATLRGLAAAGEVRCHNQAIRSMGCASFLEEKLRERLPAPDTTARQERRRERRTLRSPQDDFAAFLGELHRGDFQPSLREQWPDIATRLSHDPARLYARLVEDALHQFAKKQKASTIRSELAFDTMLQSALPIAPRTSLSALLGLRGAEVSVNVPLSKRISVDVGGTTEWGLIHDRRKNWHLISGGPVVRFGVNVTQHQTLIALIADMHAGILFGPTFPSVVDAGERIDIARAKSTPNAAVFVGIAPRIFLLRRLQLDLPIRAYWLCSNAACTAFIDNRPAYGVAIRLGWNWTRTARVETRHHPRRGTH